MTEDQKEYEKAKAAMEQAAKIFWLKRCINCTYYHGDNQCVKHGTVPDEYLYTPNECPDHEISIPF